jgi:hypothetical protein
MLSSSDKTVSSHSLSCLAAVFGNQQCMEEVGSLVQDWLQTMVESHHTSCIASIAKNYVDIVINEWEKIKPIIKSGLSHYDQQVRTTTIQILVNLCSQQQQQQIEEETLPEHVSQLTVAQQTLNKRLADTISKYRTLDLTEDMWIWILYDALKIGEKGLLRDSFHGVRLSACMILGNIPPFINVSVR